jgi:hypothetical protein
MNFGAALDVAIGLIFVYLMVSLFVTALNEYVSSFLNKRSEYLLSRVQSLLGGDGSEKKTGEWSPEMCSVWNHPLISALKSHQTAEDHCTKRGALLKNAPSYIPGKTFAVALTETLKPSETAHLSFTQLKTAISGIENNEPLKKALLPMIDEAEGKVEVFQQNVATWFDGAMDRTSGAYKRWIHRLTFWAGFAVAVAFNVNSLQLIDNLWRDPVARAGLVAQASVTAKSADDAQGAQAQLAARAGAELDGRRRGRRRHGGGFRRVGMRLRRQPESRRPGPGPAAADRLEPGRAMRPGPRTAVVPAAQQAAAHHLRDTLSQRLERDGEDLPDPAGSGDHRPGGLAGVTLLVRHPAVGDQHPRDGDQARSRGWNVSEVDPTPPTGSTGSRPGPWP